MIIFYHKDTGEIAGTIEGRVHKENHLKMWVHDRETTERLVIQWKPVRFYNRKGEEVAPDSEEVFTADYLPEHEQTELLVEIESNMAKLQQYKVDVEKKILVLIDS